MINLEQRLLKKPKIRGINTIGHLPFMERIKGSKDSKSNQLSESESGYTTPYINNMCEIKKSYRDFIFCLVTTRIGEISESIEKNGVELTTLKSRVSEPENVVGERAERHARANNAERASRLKRIEQLESELSSQRAFIEKLDRAVKHHIETADDILRYHIETYWSGFIKKSRDVKIRRSPIINERVSENALEYEAYISRLLGSIDAYLKGV